MANTVFRKDYAYYLHSIITIGIMLVFPFLPPFGTVTPLGMQLLGIFIGLIYGWTFVGLIWPSILGLLAMGCTAYGTVNQVFMQGFGHQTVLFLFFLYIFCGAVDESGVTTYIGRLIITRRFAQGRPWVLGYLLCLSAYVLGAMASTVASIILVWKILYDVCAQLGYQKGEKYPMLLVIGIIYSAALGGAVFPFKVYPMIILGTLQQVTGASPSFFKFSMLNFIITVLCITLYILVCKFVFRPQVSLKTAPIASGEKLNTYQIKILAFLAALVVAFFAPSFLPADFPLTILLNHIGTTGVVAFFILLLLLCKHHGQPLIQFRQVIASSMSWDIYFLLAAAFPLSAALVSEQTGIKAWLMTLIQPLFAGRSVFIFSIFVIILGAILSNIVSNVVTPMIIIPIMASYAADIGINPAILATLLTIVMLDSLLMPSGSPMSAILLGNKEWVTTKEVYLYAGFLLILTITIVITVGLPLGNLIY